MSFMMAATSEARWPWGVYLLVVFLLAFTVGYIGVLQFPAQSPVPARGDVLPPSAQAEELLQSAFVPAFSANTDISSMNDSLYPQDPRQILAATNGTVRTVSPEAQGRGGIVVIGDSFTYGADVPDAATYPYQLAKALSTREDGTITVVNRGVSGSGVRDYFYLFNRSVERFQPAVVVVTFDPESDALSLPLRHRVNDWARRYLHRRGIQNYSYASDGVFEQTIQWGYRQFRTRTNRTMLHWYLDPLASRPESQCPAIVFYAYTGDLTDQQRTYWRSWADSHGFPLFAAPPKLAREEYQLSPSDPHYTPEGYRILAQHLAAHMPLRASCWER